MTGALVTLAVLAVASVFGLRWRARQGRVLASRASTGMPAEVRGVLDPGASVNLVQLSTAFCAPCRQVRALLSDLAASTQGLHHAEIDLTDRPDLARQLSVLSTPTTIAVDRTGAEILRVGGVPRRDTLLTALRPHLPNG